MNSGEIVLAVQRQFGDDSGIQITATDILRWINQAGIDIARKTGCVLDHKETTSVANDGSYSLPDDCINVRRVTYSDEVLLQTTMEVADQDWTTRDKSPQVSGTPQYFYIWNNILYVYPVPSTSSTGILDIWYARIPAAVTDATAQTLEIPAKFHEMIVRYCLSRAKELNDEYDVAKLVMNDYNDMVLDAKDEVNRPGSRSYSAVRLLPGDDW